jgi:hypothetical protein
MVADKKEISRGWTQIDADKKQPGINTNRDGANDQLGFSDLSQSA